MNTLETKDVQKLIDEEVSKSYFYGWNLLINGLIAIIPTGILIRLLKDLGMRHGSIIAGSLILFGFIYLIGFTREKISSKKIKNGKTQES